MEFLRDVLNVLWRCSTSLNVPRPFRPSFLLSFSYSFATSSLPRLVLLPLPHAVRNALSLFPALYYLLSPFSSLSLSSFVQVDCERGIDPPRRKARLTRPTVISSHPDCRYPSSARPPLADHRLPNSAISKLAFVHVVSLAIVFHSLFFPSLFSPLSFLYTSHRPCMVRFLSEFLRCCFVHRRVNGHCCHDAKRPLLPHTYRFIAITPTLVQSACHSRSR